MPALKNARWEKFAQLVATRAPKGKAYEQAGYRPNASGASALMKKPEIKNRIAELLELGADEALVTIEWWVDKLRENVERCMQARPVISRDVTGDEDGDPVVVGIYAYNAAGANKSLELLGKHIGAFKADNDQQPTPAGAVIVQYPINGRD